MVRMCVEGALESLKACVLGWWRVVLLFNIGVGVRLVKINEWSYWGRWGLGFLGKEEMDRRCSWVIFSRFFSYGIFFFMEFGSFDERYEVVSSRNFNWLVLGLIVCVFFCFYIGIFLLDYIYCCFFCIFIRRE